MYISFSVKEYAFPVLSRQAVLVVVPVVKCPYVSVQCPERVVLALCFAVCFAEECMYQAPGFADCVIMGSPVPIFSEDNQTSV
jgi:hypothetical protein